MTRILRIEMCDECPHALVARACKRAEVGDGKKFTLYYQGSGEFRDCRKFDDYPLIPEWCPLEQDGPDWKPSVKEERS